jgi:hypothetical protein
MVAVSCKKCGTKFFAKPSHIKYGYAKYCSKECHHAGMKTGTTETCHQCGKKVYRAPRMADRTKSGFYFCGKSCQTQWRNQLYIGDKHANYKDGEASYRSILGRHGVKKACNLCKTKDFRVIAVHHIDHNRKNNSVENLTYLCHNCHHLVHRYPQERERLG